MSFGKSLSMSLDSSSSLSARFRALGFGAQAYTGQHATSRFHCWFHASLGRVGVWVELGLGVQDGPLFTVPLALKAGDSCLHGNNRSALAWTRKSSCFKGAASEYAHVALSLSHSPPLRIICTS